MQRKHAANREELLRKNFGVNTKISFSKVMLKMSREQLHNRRRYLQYEHGFTEEEQRYIGRQKPNFFLYDMNDQTGIKAISSLLKEEYGFKKELIRTLVLKSPTILGKTKSQIKFFFNYMKQTKEIDEITTMQKIFEVPALLNVDIASKSSEVDELFDVYHKITPEEVKDIFLDFPYLYCCPSQKLQTFLAEFRKYGFTKDQILNIVSILFCL